MRIFVRTPAGKTVTLDMKSSDTVADVKQKIQDTEEGECCLWQWQG